MGLWKIVSRYAYHENAATYHMCSYSLLVHSFGIQGKYLRFLHVCMIDIHKSGILVDHVYISHEHLFFKSQSFEMGLWKIFSSYG